MKKKHLFLLQLFLPFMVGAQIRAGAPGSAVLYIGANTYVTAQGNVTSLNDIAGTGTLALSGGSLQTLNMGGKKIPALNINNTANIVLSGDAAITGMLTFAKGKLFTNNQLLTVLPSATMQGYSSTQYVSTSDASDNTATTGGLQFTVPAGASVFAPVGPNSANYNPVTIQNMAGPDEQYTVLVNPAPVPGVNSSLAVQVNWNLTEAAPGGNSIGLTLQWKWANQAAGFNKNNMKIVRSNGAAVVEKSGIIAALGNNPYTASGGSFTGVSIFGATSDPNAFAAGISVDQIYEKQLPGESINMYPTLIQGNAAKLVLNVPADAKYLYVISDMSGKAIATSEIEVWKGDNTLPVILPNMAAGMYIMSIYDKTSLKKSIKFLKQ